MPDSERECISKENVISFFFTKHYASWKLTIDAEESSLKKNCKTKYINIPKLHLKS